MAVDEGYDLIAPGTFPPGATLEIAAEGRAGVVLPGVQTPIPLGRTWALDFAARRFLPGTAGGPLAVRGLDALAQWIEKCLRTPRGGALALNEQFGVDVLPHEVFQGGTFDLDVAEGAVEDWTTALQIHPRIDAVEDMRLIGDELHDFAALVFRVSVQGIQDVVPFSTAITASGLTRYEGE